MKLNILSVITIFVLFIPVSFADDVIGPVMDDDSVYDLDDSVYDDAAREAIEKSRAGTDYLLNLDSILILSFRQSRCPKYQRVPGIY